MIPGVRIVLPVTWYFPTVKRGPALVEAGNRWTGPNSASVFWRRPLVLRLNPGLFISRILFRHFLIQGCPRVRHRWRITIGGDD